MWGPILAWVRKQIGQRTDTASATGSAHAKLAYIAGKDIVANGSAIKSIQRGVISLSDSQTSNTATISAVVVEKSVIMPLGVSGEDTTDGNYAVDHLFIRLSLTNTTTVTATRTRPNSIAATVGYQVIEFY